MKALNLIIAILLCTQAYGQDFDFNDLKVIDSEKAYKRFCFENGFTLTDKAEYTRTYAFNYDKTAETATIWSNYYLGAGYWDLDFARSRFNNSATLFEDIYNEVKRECTFFDFIVHPFRYDEREYICYSCPSSKYSGKIGFYIGDEGDAIAHFPMSWLKN